MTTLQTLLGRRPNSRLSVLCIGAHSDDIEIGCGGTMLRLIQEEPDISVAWVVFGASGQRAQEARASAEAFLGPVADKNIVVKSFRDGYFPYEGAQIKDTFEELKRKLSPDVVFTHYRHDLHQDHRCVSDLTWNTFRSQLILEYEIPKYDGDLGTPNFFVALDDDLCRRKVASLLAHFASQTGKFWFREEVFTSLMRLRGVEARAANCLAEAFYSRKLVI
jgi:LmbE family N-acetylglucosaminyl deacetylase